MYVEIVTPPAEYPVSVAEVKKAAVIDHTDDDTLVEEYLQAAIADLDPPYGILGRAMVEQTLKLHMSGFNGRTISLPYPPLISVESVKYTDSDGVEQAVSTDEYEVITHQEPGYIALLDGESWPTDLDEIQYPVQITYKAGYETSVTGEGEDEVRTITVPAGIKQYIKLLVAEMYKERELTQNMGIKRNVHWFNLIEKYRFRMGG